MKLNIVPCMLILIFLTPFIFSQNGWFQQTSGTSEALRSVFLINSNIVWAVGDNRTILESIDGGQTWTSQIDPLYDVYLNKIFFSDSLTGTIVGGDLNYSLVLHTIDGGNNWIVQNVATTGLLYGVHMIDNNTATAVGIKGIIIRTTNGGQNWVTQSNSPFTHSYRSVYFADENNGVVVGFIVNGIIFRTTNGGQDWINQTHETYPKLHDVFLLDSLRGIIVGENGTILMTTDGGTTWIHQVTSITENLYEIFFTDVVNGWIVGSGGTILRTTDGGINWLNQSSGISTFIFSVHFTDSLTGNAVGGYGTILRTIAGGIPVTLNSITANILDNNVQLNWTTATETNNSGFEILRYTPMTLIGNDIGFVPGFGTTTEPKSYSFIDEDVTRGIYKYRLKQIDFDGSFEYSSEIEVEVDFTPKEFVLYQNYPNPFNPNTIISWQSPVSSHQTLKIYDVLGNEVVTLVDEYRPAGKYELEFNPETSINYPASGVYFYQLKVTEPESSSGQGFISIKKMILLR